MQGIYLLKDRDERGKLMNKKYISRLNNEILNSGVAKQSDVYNCFKKFVKNQTCLKKRTELGGLQYEYNYYMYFIKDSIFEDLIIEIIDIYRTARKVDEESTKKVLIDLYPRMICSGERVTVNSDKLFEVFDRDNREDYAIFNAFEYIGRMIEGGNKDYIIFIDSCNRVIKSKEIKKFKLGVHADNLLQNNKIFESVYKDMLLNEKITDWRNVANHDNYQILDDGVNVTFGQGDSLRNKMYTFEEVKLLAKTIEVISYAHKIALTMITNDLGDEIDEIRKNIVKSDNKRKDDMVAQLVESSLFFGCKLEKIDWEKNEIWFTEISSNKNSMEKLMNLSDAVIGSYEYNYYFQWKEKVHFSTSYRNGKRIVYEWKV